MTTPLIIDASTMVRYLRCPREYYHYHELKRESSGSRAGLMFGKVIHKGVEIWRKTADVMGVSVAIEDEYKKQSIPLDNYRTLALAQAVMEKYIATYPKEPYKTITNPSTGDLAIEVAFAVPFATINGVEVFWSGRVDELCELPDGKLIIKDTKTSSRGGETFWREYELSFAQWGYCWAVEKLFGILPDSYLIDAIFIGEPKKDSTSRIEPMRRRFPIVYSNINEWYATTHSWLVDLIVTTGLDSFNPNFAACCSHKYGACEYLNVCSLAEVNRPTMLASSMYQDVTWSPLNKD